MKTKGSPKVGKLLVPAALCAAVAFGQSANAANRQLEYVPHDTTFYFGTGKPVAVDDLFAMVPDMFGPESLERMSKDVSEKQRVFINQLVEFFENPTKVTRDWGLGDELQLSAYTIGILPVLRVEGDARQFETAIAKLESERDVEFDAFSHKDIDVRILAPEKKESDKPEIVAPPAAEIEKAEAAVAAAIAESDAAGDALKTATAKLDSAKESNDASGIAEAANEIGDAAALIAEVQKKQSEAESALAKLNQTKANAEKIAMSGGKAGPGLIIAADGKDLVFAFSPNAYDPELLDQLLGITKPAESIEASGKVKQIRKEWGYGEEIAMFVDFKLIADSLTGGESAAAQQLKSFMMANDDMDGELGVMATEPCKSEIRQMAEHWPMLVSGNRKFEVTDNRIDVNGHMAMLLENDALRDTLKLLRGVVPVSQSNGDAMMSFGMGLNVDNLPQLSSRITEIVSSINYSCEPLTSLNKIGESDISSLSMGAMMFSGMARGIKGFSVNLYDAEVAPESRGMPVNSVDAAIAIAAEDPTMLVNTLRMLPQMDILSELPLDGSAMSLNDVIPVPLPAGIEIFAAVKGKNIVLYSGEQAANFSNRLSGDGKEGFMLSSINTKKLMDKLATMKDLMSADVGEDEADMLLEFVESYPRGDVFYQFDFTDRGIEMESVSNIERPSK